MGGLQIRFMFALTEWGPGAATHTPEGGEAFKETPRKAILSLFFFEMRPDNPIILSEFVALRCKFSDGLG